MKFNPLRSLPLWFGSLVLLAPASAQVISDSVDFDLNPTFLRNPSNPARMIDMEFTQNGHLLIAFVERDTRGMDRLIVVRRNPNGYWFVLTDRSYGYGEILELALAVPEEGDGGNPDRDRLYVVAHMVHEQGGPPIESLMLMHGPWMEPWHFPLLAIEETLPLEPPRPRTAWNPGIACVPTEPGDYREYTLEIAFAYPALGSQTDMSVLRSRSEDYGETLEPVRVIAGPQGSGGPELEGASYSQPSITTDGKQARVVVAMRDDYEAVIRVVADTSNNPILPLIHSTEGKDRFGNPKREHSPVLACYDRDVFMTHLSTDPNNADSMSLSIQKGTSTTGNFHVPVEISPYVASKGDIAVREGQIFVVVRRYSDNVWPQQSQLRGWTANFDYDGFWSSALDDQHCNSLSPKVAVNRSGLIPLQTVGFSTTDGSINPSMRWTTAAGTVSIDL